MLHGKSVIVTGAGSGIGESAARLFASQGASLLLADIDPVGVRRVADEIRASGARVAAIGCDVSRNDEVKAMVAAAVAAFGRLDGAFNNAGVAQAATNTVDCDEAVFDRLMAVNAKGVWNCLRNQIPAMLASGRGSIVVNASLAGIRANPWTPAYIASKHAAVALTQGAAIEYGNQGVRVNAICPGLVRTSMMYGFLDSMGGDNSAIDRIALPGRWGDADEVAGAALWLLSDASGFVNGVALPVDGGKVAA